MFIFWKDNSPTGRTTAAANSDEIGEEDMDDELVVIF